MKKIILIANNYWNIKNFRINLCEELKKQYDLMISAQRDEYRDFLVKKGFKCHDSPVSRGWVGVFKEIWALYKILINLFIKFDLYVLYTVKVSIYYGFFLRLIKRKYIIVITGFGSYFQVKKGILFKIFLYICSGASKVIVQNEDDFLLLSAYEINLLKINGSGVELPKKINYSTGDGHKIKFLMIGRIIKDKGIIEYLESANIIIKKYSNVEFRLIGAFDDVNPTALNFSHIENYLNKKILYLGYKDNITKEIEASDVIVLPSYTEGLSKALLEGAAYGKPLLATNIAGCRVICRNNYNGYLCEPRDIDSLISNMDRLISMTNDKRIEFGKKSRKLVEDLFEISKINKFYIDAIREAVNED